MTTIILSIIPFYNVFASADRLQFPPENLGTLHTYTVWDKIRWGGDCRKLINYANDMDAISDSYGIVTYGKYFAGALTSTFGDVGDMLLVVQKHGIVYPVIIADIKNQNDYGCTVWGHQYGKCIVEFEILSSCRKSLYGESGGFISSQLANPIYKTINIGSVYDNGLSGYLLLTNPYGGITVGEHENKAVQVAAKNTETHSAIECLYRYFTMKGNDYFRSLISCLK